MSLDIEAALSRGLDRTVQKNGLLLVGIFAVVNAVQSVIQASFYEQLAEVALDEALAAAETQDTREAIIEAQGELGSQFPLAYLDVPVGLLGVLWILLGVVGIVLNVGAIRTFVSDQTDRLPVENFTRRLVWMLLNLVVGLVIYGLVVGIGLVLFVIPGIFFAVAFFFYNYEIVVDEKNVIEAFSGSWNLTSGNRLLLFVLGLIFLLVSSFVSYVLGFVFGGTAAGSLFTTLVTTVIAVLGIAVAAQAYNQLRGTRDGVPGPGAGHGPGHGQDPQGGHYGGPNQPGQGQQPGQRGQQGGQPGQPGQGPGQQGGQSGQPGRQGGQHDRDRDDVY